MYPNPSPTTPPTPQHQPRVAEVGSLLSKAKIAMKIFVNRIYYFRDKCFVFARNRKFANLTQYNMQYILCNSALLAQETLFFTQKGIFLPEDFQKVRKSRQILISQ